MANWQHELDQIDAEIAAAEQGRANLQATLRELEAEYESFQVAAAVNVSTLPIDLVRPTVESATRLAIEGPTLKRTIREVARRLEKSDNDLSNLRQRRGSASSQLIAQRAAAMLVSSKELAKTQDLISDVLALWGPHGAAFTQIGKATRDAQQALKALSDAARATGAG